MKKLNLRPFSTPLIIGTGLFSATTGLLMFFVSEDPFKYAHEIIGIGFSVAILLHIYTNWRPFNQIPPLISLTLGRLWMKMPASGTRHHSSSHR